MIIISGYLLRYVKSQVWYIYFFDNNEFPHASISELFFYLIVTNLSPFLPFLKVRPNIALLCCAESLDGFIVGIMPMNDLEIWSFV